MTTVCVSGHFDPLHVGHIKHIQAAAKLGAVVVILSTDEQCIAKKGYCFMPYEERREILKAMRCVHSVVPNVDNDDSSTKSLERYHPDIFAKGGDRDLASLPKTEVQVCSKLGIKIVFGVGGSKVQSSSKLARNAHP